MKTLKIFTLINAATILLSGCIDYPIYDLPYDDYGKIASLMTDWNERGEDIDIPVHYTAKIGNYVENLAGIDNSIDYLFPVGHYIINIWNSTNHIAISNMVATTDYTAGDAGWLFAGRREALIEKDKEHSFTVFMQQQVRQLRFELEITDNAVYRYTGVSATLSGVAGTLNMDNGTHDVPVVITLTFAENSEDNRWKASTRLLGMTGNIQTLTLTVHLADALPASYTFTSDVSRQLASFNEDKKTPLTLVARLDGTHNNGELTANISDWISEETFEGTADEQVNNNQ